MGCFEERNLFRSNECRNCRHGVFIQIYYGDQRDNEYFCMLDVPQSTVYEVQDEIMDHEEEYYCQPDLWKLTPQFLEVMQINEGQSPLDSPRHVGASCCCQFYRIG